MLAEGCGAQVQEDLQIRPIKIVLTVPNRRLQKCTYFLSLIQAFTISSSAFHPSSPSVHSTAQLYLQGGADHQVRALVKGLANRPLISEVLVHLLAPRQP